MSLDVNVIKMAIDKKYSDFSDAIKTVLHSKLSSHADVQAYSNEYDRIQSMKSDFSNIVSKGQEQ